MRAVHRILLKEVLDNNPKILLDVGCADGVFTRVLANALPHSFIYATDTAVSKRFVSANNISFIKGSAECLPFEEESFDMVVASLSFHHWTDKEKGIKEVHRVLKKGGTFLIGDPLLENWLSNKFWGWLTQTIDRGSFSSFQELNGYLTDTGFTSVYLKPVPDSMNSLFLIVSTKQ